ncbi:MAG: hypothetical protein SF066_01685 [Thermoanaerobaculia bacterium]|nr:hypothetical protein [Thermoanaerobaculia bacterium]
MAKDSNDASEEEGLSGSSHLPWREDRERPRHRRQASNADQSVAVERIGFY